jgi:hypothetical protein
MKTLTDTEKEMQTFLGVAFAKAPGNPLEAFQNLSKDALDYARSHQILEFVVYKAFEPEQTQLQPLANHLLEDGEVKPSDAMVKLALTHAFQCQTMLDAMKNTSDELNKHMAGFHFDEKVIITNQPLEAMNNLFKKVYQCAEPAEQASGRELLASVGISADKINELTEIPQKRQPKL